MADAGIELTRIISPKLGDNLRSAYTEFTKAGKGVTGFKAGIVELVNSISPVTYAIAGITAVTTIAAGAVAFFTESFSEAVNKVEESRNAYENTKTELKSLNSELETNQNRIDELKTKGVLSITEKDELSSLKQQNSLLQDQIEIKQRLANIQQNQVAKDAANVLTKERFTEDSSNPYGGEYNKTEDVIESATRKQNELNDTTEKYNNLLDEQTKLEISGKKDTSQYKKNEKELKKYEDEIEDLSKSLSDDLDIVSENYSSLFNDDGSKRKGQEDLISRCEDLFNLTTSSSEKAAKGAKEIDDIFNRPTLKNVKQELIEMAENSDNMGISVDKVKSKYPELASACKEAGISMQDLVDEINSSAGIIDVDEVKKQLTDAFNVDAEKGEFKNFLNGLDTKELKVLYGIYNSQDTSGWSIDDFKQAMSEASNDAQQSIDDVTTNVQTMITNLSKAQEVLNSQQNGKSISFADYDSDELKDYQSALEYTNGTMQLNADKVREIAKAKAEEQLATNEANKAIEQAKYLDNARQIDEYKQKLESKNFAEGETAASIQSQIDALSAQNSTIAQTCQQYDLLSASIQEAVGSYQHWLNAQGASDYGDMASDAVGAISRIRDTYNEDSDIYGNFGSKKFEAAVEFVVPESVDRENIDAIQSYMSDFKQYLTFDDNGNATGLDIDTFLKKSVDAGLMTVDESGENFEIAGGKVMKDFAEGLNMSSGMVQAFFDELQLKGGDFDWSDESTDSLYDLGSAASDAKEQLGGLKGFENLDIKIDVSDIEDQEEKIETLDDTIDKMQKSKTKLKVDSSEYQAANSIIRYCMEQKQQLSAPAIMDVDTSVIQGKMGEAVGLLQQFQTALNELEVAKALGIDTSDAQAKVDSLVQKIQSSDNQKIMASLDIDTSSVSTISSTIQSLTPEMMVHAGIDDSAIIGYSPENKEAKVTYEKDSSAVDGYNPPSFKRKVTYSLKKPSYDPPDLTRTLTYKIETKGSVPGNKTVSKEGSHSLNGTAHISGTAKASGDWGTAPGGRTLVGELGREIVVDPHTGRWYTVGDNGAEFKDIPAGSIVFNHLQTESLLEYGYVSGRAAALVSGTAMISGNIKRPKSNQGGTGGGGNGGGGGGNGGGGNNTQPKTTPKKTKTKTALEKFQEWFEKLFDWIEIKLKRQTDKINKLITDAENQSDAGDYKHSSSNYRKAINETATQVKYEEQAEKKYASQADKILSTAKSKKVITDKQAKSIRTKVKNGTMDISEYSEGVREVIQDYQEWYEKSLAAGSAIDELHNNIRTYIKDLKDMRDAQRDAKIDTIDTYSSIAESGYYSESGRYYGMNNTQLSYKNTQLRKQNRAYNDNVQNVNSDINSIKKSASGALSSQLKKSNLKKYAKNKKLYNEYKKALTNAQKAVKAKKKVSDSDLETIRKRSIATYEKLYAYNLSLDNLELAKLEAATNYAANSSEIYENISESYENSDKATENLIDLYEDKSRNSKDAKSANKLLEKAASQYDKIAANNSKEVKQYSKDVASKKKLIIKPNKKFQGTSFFNRGTAGKRAVNKLIDRVQATVKSGKAITASVIAKLAEYYSEGLINYNFYQACVDYNNALEHKREAEAQKEIDAETIKQEKAALAEEMVSNIEQEYENKLAQNSAKTERIENQQAIKSTKGIALTSSDYSNLISQSKIDQKLYEDEAKAVYNQIKKNLTNGYWTTNSQEYKDALASYEDYKNSALECIKSQEEWNNEIANLPYSTIEKALELLDSIADYNKSVADLKEAEGTDLSESDYLNQIEDNNKKIKEYEAERAQAYEDYLKALANADHVYGGKTADEWLSKYYELKTSVNDLRADNEGLKDDLRDDVYWRAFERAHEECERFKDVLSGIMDLIDKDMYFDKDGNLTKYGVSQIANLVSEYETARKEVENYSRDIANLNDLYQQGYYTQEEYKEKLGELQTDMLDSASDMKSAIGDIIEIYKDMESAELDALYELIDARNEALTKKKEYYSYDKTISSKTKDIQNLQAQIAALEGINTAEAKAKKAKLEADLADKQDDLNDTINNHVLELSQDALKDMEDTLKEAFDDKWDHIYSDLEAIADLMSAANALTSSSAETINATLNELLKFYGINPVSTGVDAAYASGTKYVPKKMRALIGENGDEIVTTKDGIILTLDKGDGVIPAEMTKNLIKMARGSYLASHTVMPKTNIPKVEMGHNTPNVNQHFDNLINIEGSADAATVSDLKKMQKDLLQESYQYTSKKMFRGYMDGGGLRRI